MNSDFLDRRISTVGLLLGLASTPGLRADEVVGRNGNHVITVPSKGGNTHRAERGRTVITITGNERIIYRDQVIAPDNLAHAFTSAGISPESRISMKVDSQRRYPFLRSVLKALADHQSGRNVSVSIPDAKSISK